MHRAERERNQLRAELDDARTQIDHLQKSKGSGKPSKEVEAQLGELQQRLEVRVQHPSRASARPPFLL